MNKKILSLSIIILSACLIIFNLWKTSIAGRNKASEELAMENIPGVDLSQVLEGNPAPDFELATIDGKMIKLSDYKGKKVILNFWATWCPPCREEMPHMQNFYEKNKENDIEIIAVNLASMDSSKAAIETFINEFKLTFLVPLDEEGLIGMQYQAFTVPTSYIINSNGIITKKIVGPMDERMLETLTNEVQ